MSTRMGDFGRDPAAQADANRADTTLVLVAAVAPETRRSCKEILSQSGYTLIEASRYSDVAALLCRIRPAVILAESRLGDGAWKDILGLIAPLHEQPVLIVMDRLADESLWAEVLSEGAFDLLAQPLDADELQRTLAGALRQRTWRAAPRMAGRALVAGAA